MMCGSGSNWQVFAGFDCKASLDEQLAVQAKRTERQDLNVISTMLMHKFCHFDPSSISIQSHRNSVYTPTEPVPTLR